ncbi:MAG: hypothetical protein WAP47_11535 [Candidatus Rokuibacteriota bacterium]
MTPSPLPFRFVSLQAKLLWGTVLVILLVMAALVAIVDNSQRSAIVEEVQRRGRLLARNLAAVSTGPLLLYNFTALEQNVAQVAQETDVAYAIILDPEGKVAAHSALPAVVGSSPGDPVSQRAVRADDPLVQEARAPDGKSLF